MERSSMLKFRIQRLSSVLVLLGGFAAGCGDDDEASGAPAACSVADNAGCAAGLECQNVAGGQPACFCSPTRGTGCPGENGTELACEEVPGGNSGCFAPVHVQGSVFDLAS